MWYFFQKIVFLFFGRNGILSVEKSLRFHWKILSLKFSVFWWCQVTRMDRGVQDIADPLGQRYDKMNCFFVVYPSIVLFLAWGNCNGKFYCWSSLYNKHRCVTEEELCDGINQCESKVDELMCPRTYNSINFFSCKVYFVGSCMLRMNAYGFLETVCSGKCFSEQSVAQHYLYCWIMYNRECF